jgi:hypothetical protein|tara:strand:+ start:306 stop:1199 length:894 start_codon:yes stop_codon:yes gene_type:complete
MADDEEERLLKLAEKLDKESEAPVQAPSRIFILRKGKRSAPKSEQEEVWAEHASKQIQEEMTRLVTDNPFADASDEVGTQLYLVDDKGTREAVKSSRYLTEGVPISEQIPNIKVIAGRLPFVTRYNSGKMTASEYVKEFGGVLNEYAKRQGRRASETDLDEAAGGEGLARKQMPEHFKRLKGTSWDSVHGHSELKKPDEIRNRPANLPRQDNLRAQEELARLAVSEASKFNPYGTTQSIGTKEEWMRDNFRASESDWEEFKAGEERGELLRGERIKENFPKWDERLTPRTRNVLSGY